MTTRKLAIVTGGTRGIGAATAKALKEKGYLVVSLYGNDDEVASKFHHDTGIMIKKCDVSDFKQCQDSIASIEEQCSRNVSILVNNAGITRDGMLHKSSKQQWDEVMNTNLSSCFNMSFAVINKMRNNNFGRIINISSINGQAGQFGQTNYSAAKAGIIGFTKALALESAIKNITVNAIAPGYTKTDMTDRVDPLIMNSIIEKIPMRRLGMPDEIARGVVFLAADEASFITGQVIAINGGQYM